MARRFVVPRVGKKPGDSHSFGLNDWILFDEAAPRTVQSFASPADAGHAHPPRRTPDSTTSCFLARTPFLAYRRSPLSTPSSSATPFALFR